MNHFFRQRVRPVYRAVAYRPVQGSILRGWSLFLLALFLVLIAPTLTVQAQGPAPIAQGMAATSGSGNRVSINGRLITADWQMRSQSTQQIGIGELGLMQGLGLDLLNSSDPSRQPVQWFSDPQQTPLALSAWMGSGGRYLDIKPLADRQGWRVQANGNTLQIQVPAAQINSIRRGRQTWGDRIVLDLNQPATWQIAEQPGEFSLTLDADLSPAAFRDLDTGSGNRIRQIQATSGRNQTVIRANYDPTARPRVWTLPNPNRVIIDVRQEDLIPRDISWAPGVRWRQQYVSLGAGPFPVYSLVIDPRQPAVTLRPVWTDPTNAVGISPLTTMAQRWQAQAAINAGFFNRNNQLPLGAVRDQGRWISGPILNRGAIAWNDSGTSMMGRLALQQILRTDNGQQFTLQGLNSGYVGAGIGLYTPTWGSTYSSILDGEILVFVESNGGETGRVLRQQNAGAAGTTVPLPSNGYLLAVRANTGAAAALTPGTGLTLSQTTIPAAFNDYPHIAAGGPLLLQNRQVVLNAAAEGFSSAFASQSAPRSAIGRLADGSLVIAAAHNRPGGSGPTLAQMAQIMQQLGCVDALNLDGGSSTSLYLGGRLINRDPRTAGRVHNGIGLFIQP